jgi:integrase
MAIPVLRQADNGFYYAHWSDGRRSKRSSMGTKQEAEAKERFAQWLLIGGQTEALGVLTVAELWKVYRQRHKVASPETLDRSWKNLEPHFGAMTPAEIDDEAAQAYLAKRAAGKIGRPSKAPTVRRELVAMRGALNWCADPKRKLLDPAALPHFDLPEAGEPRDRWLKADEIKRLLAGAETLRRGPKLARVEIFLWLALETAARKRAILELTWDRVDFETKVIHYNVPGRTQTKKRRTDVPISKALLPVLERAYKERENDLVMMNGADVWASVQWAAIRGGFSKQVTKHSERPKATGISPHVLRHTAATHMARRGVALWIIAKVLGNTLAMVEKVYAKHSPDDLRAAVDTITGDLEDA